MIERDPRASRCGLTLIELVIALAAFSVLMVAATLNLSREAEGLTRMATRTHVQSRIDVVLDRIADELEFAQGVVPVARLTADVFPGTTSFIEVDTTAGFPFQGTLLLDPGTAREERIAYSTLGSGPPRFQELERGAQCSSDAAHLTGAAPVRWAPMAAALENQVNPPAEFFDGASEELGGTVFYRGDGTGFAYRVPVDLLGDGDYFDANGDIVWGARVRGAATASGFSILYFSPGAVVTEAARGLDLNLDGDQDDTFDLGRIRMRTWDGAAPDTEYSDVALCPPLLLQEQCTPGADLDGDGASDPLFLWEARSGRLRVRMFVLTGDGNSSSVVQRFESTFFLSNGIER